MHRNNSSNGTGEPSFGPHAGRPIVRKTQCAGKDDKIISMIQNRYPYLSSFEKVGGFAYSTFYYIFVREESRKVNI